MALVSTVLEDGVTAMVNAPVVDPKAACDAFAGYYMLYASVAQAGVAVPTFTGLEQDLFSANLLTAFGADPLPNDPATVAQAFVTAMTTFWMTPPVVFGAGQVTAFAGAAALLAGLTTLFSTTNDTATIASSFATLMDVATKTVVVTIGTSTFNLS